MEREDVRLAIYRRFAEEGEFGSAETLAGELGIDPSRVRRAMGELADARHLVLDEAGEVVMAHPFAAVPLGFAVMGAHTLWWGGCAWDSFALPHLVGGWRPDLLLDGTAVLVSTTCPGCGRAHAWTVGRTSPPEGEQVAHFRSRRRGCGMTWSTPAVTSASSAPSAALTGGSKSPATVAVT